MKRYIFLLGFLALAGIGFGTGLDSLRFFFSQWTASPIESVMVTMDTSSSEYDTVYSTSGGYASFVLPTTGETYIFRAIKAGYYKDSTHVYARTLSANDAITHDILWRLDPYKMNGGAVIIVANDSLVNHLGGIQLDLVDSGGDTLFSDTTDVKGSWAFPDDSLSIGTTYTLYATDPDSVYANKHVTFTYDSINTVVSIALDSAYFPTMNKIEIPVYDFRTGIAKAGVAAEVSYSMPNIKAGTGGLSSLFVGNSIEYFYSDQSGMITILTPDSTWVEINIRSGSFDAGFYSIGDTTLDDLKVR